MYPATNEEVKIFCPKETFCAFNRTMDEIYEHNSRRLCNVDTGFIGECQNEYELFDGGILEVVISFEHIEPYYGVFYYEGCCSPGRKMLCGYLPSFDDYTNYINERDNKAYMFRLVLCWMKQQSEKGNNA